MQDVTLAYAKEHLEELLIRVAQGEEIAISVPRVGTVQLAARSTGARDFPPRMYGQWRHLADISDERLLEPLTNDELSWLSGELSEAP